MCGFAGSAWGRHASDTARRSVGRMTDSIRHRGPNSEGRISTPFCEVGFRRLSIIDLDGGHQPLANEDGSLQVFLNGEIYNYAALREELGKRGHVLRTRSDTEVLPHLWEEEGPGCLERLNGMFALCVVDHNRGEVWVARDRVGIKPMYFAERPEGVFFGSELKALLASGHVPRELDPLQIPRYLDTFSAGGRETLVRGVRRLMPGELMRVDERGRVEVRRWYDLGHELSRAPSPSSPAEVIDLLREAVSMQLVADVPLGVSLSGGIDSTTLALLAREVGHEHVRAFTVDFDDAPREELESAREVAEALALELVVVRSTTRDYVDEAARCVWFNDEPVADPAFFPALKLAEAASQAVTVLLAGSGADELFAGYGHHRLTARGRRLAATPRPLRGLGAWVARRVLGHEGERVAALLRHAEDRLPVHQLALSHLTRDEFTQLDAGCGPVRGALLAEAFGRWPAAPGLGQQLLADTLTYLPDQLLPLLDRTTMAWSVEGRVPFLDHHVVEASLRLPPEATLGPKGQGKHVLRQYLDGRVPGRVLRRSKLGFPNSIETWLAGDLGDLIGPILADPDGLAANHLPTPWIEALVASRATLLARWPVVHALLVLQIWHRLFLLEGRDTAPGESLRDLYRLPTAGARMVVSAAGDRV
jgi:asparagine synthase (glutamine-hydrolysing)